MAEIHIVISLQGGPVDGVTYDSQGSDECSRENAREIYAATGSGQYGHYFLAPAEPEQLEKYTSGATPYRLHKYVIASADESGDGVLIRAEYVGIHAQKWQDG